MTCSAVWYYDGDFGTPGMLRTPIELIVLYSENIESNISAVA